MLIRIKTFTFSIVVIVLISVGIVFLYKIPFSSHLSSNIPAPSENNPYLLIDAKNYVYPKSITAFLTEGGYAHLKEGTSRNMLLTIASTAKDAVVLVEGESDNRAEVYVALRFEKEEMALLEKGVLPDSLKKIIKNSKVAVGEKKNSWLIQASDVDASVHYMINNKRVIMTADNTSLELMNKLSLGQGDSLSKKKWKEESWPGHIEVCDGGILSSLYGKNASIKIEAAWQTRKHDKSSELAEEVRWKVSGIDKDISKFISDSTAPTKWNVSECIIPDPLLISMGVNIPNLKGAGKSWPFPLNNLAKVGKSMELNDKEVRDILSGKTVFSIGGHNQLLWFNLPGFMIEFSAEKQVLKKLITSFWEKLFFGSDPNPTKDFEFGGTASLPFSTVAMANDRIALLGLVSLESIKSRDILSRFLKEDDEIIGWMTADLPRIGNAITEMAKIDFMIDDENCFEQTPLLKEKEITENAEPDELFQPEMGFSSYNIDTANSFSNLLQNLGKVFLIWEKSDSGRLYWFDSIADEKNN